VGPLGGGGGWPGTFTDLISAIDLVTGVAEVDATRLVLCGHSAGGHLALWAAGTRCRESETKLVAEVQGVVALAAVSDLSALATASAAGAGYVRQLLGGTPNEVPDRYRDACPMQMLPLGVPQRLIHGMADATVPPAMSERFANLASAAGDDARYLPIAGANHRALISTASPSWPEIEREIGSLLG